MVVGRIGNALNACKNHLHTLPGHIERVRLACDVCEGALTRSIPPRLAGSLADHAVVWFQGYQSRRNPNGVTPQQAQQQARVVNRVKQAVNLLKFGLALSNKDLSRALEYGPKILFAGKEVTAAKTKTGQTKRAFIG